MSKFKWFRDTATKQIIVMVDDIEIARFPFDSFAETFETLKQDDSCLLDKIYEIFDDEALALSLEQAELA